MKQSVQKFLSSVIFRTVIFTSALFPNAVVAAPAGVPTTYDQLLGAVCSIANWVFNIVLILAIAALLYAAFLFLVSGQDGGTDKRSSAKKVLFYAIVGIMIAVVARAIIFILADLVGAKVTALC